MAYSPSDTLRNRTFIGLLIAQFLAAFNDQAIHASAMFFALHKATMTETTAINLMPILFYSPWAIFCTMAAYYADRYSKQTALRLWKFAEIAIMIVATLGFWLGSQHNAAGPWLVLSCVFLMGLHSAFFVPAKYGVMPEILTPQMLSRGNGFLESLSFIAIILGTVFGGVLSYYFQGREILIGLVLLVLAIIGAVASLMIEKMPPANPDRPFPPYLYQPLAKSLRTLFRSRPLRLAVVGIAVFTFVVAYMRITVYTLGESQNPRWNEFKTSVIVGMSALGIGFGAPLAGFLSGRKIELGLVPLGTIGMVIGAVAATVTLAVLTGTAMIAGLIACIIAVGFFTGFYLVPMYTLLQHRAPKTSKGDAVATSNFINVTGAIFASAVAAVVVFGAHRAGLTPVIEKHRDVITGTLTKVMHDKHGRLVYVEVTDDQRTRRFGERPPEDQGDNTEAVDLFAEPEPTRRAVVLKMLAGVKENSKENPVTVSRYELRDVGYVLIRPASEPMPVAYDHEPLPRFLFLSAAVALLATLFILCREMPDMPARAMWVLRNLNHAIRKSHLRVIGTNNVPTDDPAILATNCRDERSRRTVVSATERSVEFVDGSLQDTELDVLADKIRRGRIVALGENAIEPGLAGLQKRVPDAKVIPVYFGDGQTGHDRYPRVAFGPALAGEISQREIDAALTSAASMPEDEH